jgi:hypothetical protein
VEDDQPKVEKKEGGIFSPVKKYEMPKSVAMKAITENKLY